MKGPSEPGSGGASEYSSLGLSSNPFNVSVAGMGAAIWADRMKEKEILKDFMTSTTNSPFTQTLVVIGDYGMGKTHSLRYLRYLAQDQGQAGVRNVVILVNNPGQNFVELYKKVVQELSNLSIKRLVDHLLEEIRSDVYKSVSDSEFLAFRADSLTLESILKRSLPLVDRDFLVFLSSYATNKNVEACLRWLNCGKLVASELKVLGLSENIDSVPKAFEILKGFFLLFNKLEMPCLLLIDEFEDLIMPLGPSARIRTGSEVYEYLSQLRHIIDENLPRLGVVMALTPSSWEALIGREMYPALIDRFRGNILLLGTLTNEQIFSFIEGYLKSYSEKREVNDLFDHDALNSIVKESNGNPRRIIQICQKAIDICGERGLKKVSEACIREASRELKIYFER